MSLVRRAVATALERRGADPTAPWGDSTPPAPGALATMAAGGVVSERTALQVAAVYGSVGVIADAIATLPWDLLTSKDPATRRKLPLPQLLQQPYVEISRMDWLTQYAMSMALRGNFYGSVVERDQDFNPSQIKPIHPDSVRVRRLPDGSIEYRFSGQVVPIDDVFHVRYLTVPGSLVGLNPIEYLRNTLGLARAQDLHGGAFYGNSALPLGTIEVDDDLDDEETLALARAWMAAHQGVGQSHLPAVLTGGAKFNPIAISPKDAQFIEGMAFSQGQISGMIFRVPPHMIGIVDRSTSWGTGISQQEQGFVTNTLGGYLGRAEEALTAITPGRRYVEFDLNRRLRGDKLQRYQGHSLGILGGFLCADEARAEENLPPIPDGLGKTFLAPINTGTLKAAVDASMQPDPANQPPPSDGKGGTDG